MSASACVCMSVNASACVHVSECECMCVHVSVNASACVRVHVCVRVYVCVSASAYECEGIVGGVHVVVRRQVASAGSPSTMSVLRINPGLTPGAISQ